MDDKNRTSDGSISLFRFRYEFNHVQRIMAIWISIRYFHRIHRRQHATDDADMSKHMLSFAVLRLFSQLTHFKLYSFRFQFRWEVLLESVNSARVDATGREYVSIINNSIRKKHFPITQSRSFLKQFLVVFPSSSSSSPFSPSSSWKNNLGLISYFPLTTLKVSTKSLLILRPSNFIKPNCFSLSL